MAFSKYFFNCKFLAILSFTSVKLLFEPSSEFIISFEFIFDNKIVLLFAIVLFIFVLFSFSSCILLLILKVLFFFN